MTLFKKIMHKKSGLFFQISRTLTALKFGNFQNRWLDVIFPSNSFKEENQLRLMTYNILADSNIEIDMYPHTFIEDLKWIERSKKILK